MSSEIELGRHIDKTRRQLLGVEIFSTGTFVPSTGPTREWTIADIDDIIAAFNDGVPEAVHVKLGHTTPEFAQLVADKLDVPLEVVKGEDPEGDGQISLGRVATLRRRQTKMIADLEVPNPVAEIVMKGFSTVSVEMIADFEGHPWVLSAVALLGAERPAVKDLAGLAEAAVLVERKPVLVATFKVKNNQIQMTTGNEPTTLDLDEVGQAFEDAMKGKRGAPFIRQVWNEIKGKLESLMGKTEHQEDEMDNATLIKQLKLQETATPEEVTTMIDGMVDALAALKEALGLGPEAAPEEVAEAAKEQLKEVAKFKEGGNKELVTLKEQVEALTRSGRTIYFREQVGKLTALEGKPEDLAERLVITEEKQGEAAATALLSDWQRTQGFAEKAGVLVRLGTSREGDQLDFMGEVAKYKEANPKASEKDAQAAVRVQHPGLWTEHSAAVTIGNSS